MTPRDPEDGWPAKARETMAESPIRGLGLYLRARTIVAEPHASALRSLQRAGATWAALMVEAPEGHSLALDRLVSLSALLRDHGISVWLWSFPAPVRAASAGVRLGDAIRACEAVGGILDVERPPPSLPVAEREEWTEAAAAALVRGTLDGMDEGRGTLAVTSYPVPSAWRTSIPWPALTADVGMPQLYKSASVDGVREASLREYAELYPHVIPLVGDYLGDAARLRADLHRVVWAPWSGPGDPPRVPGVGVWSLESASGAELDVLREVSAQAGW